MLVGRVSTGWLLDQLEQRIMRGGGNARGRERRVFAGDERQEGKGIL